MGDLNADMRRLTGGSRRGREYRVFSRRATPVGLETSRRWRGVTRRRARAGSRWSNSLPLAAWLRPFANRVPTCGDSSSRRAQRDADLFLIAARDERLVDQRAVARGAAILSKLTVEALKETAQAREFAKLGTWQTLGSTFSWDSPAGSVALASVVVSYIKYVDLLPRGSSKTQPEERYLALVANWEAPIRAVALGPAYEVEDISAAFLRAVSNAQGQYAAPARAAYAKLVQPLERYFIPEGSPLDQLRLIISPDGQLFEIPFAAILDRDTFLADRYRIELSDTMLDATSILRRTISDPLTSLTIFANPTTVWKRLVPLPSADMEAKEVAALFPQGIRNVILHERATVDEVVTKAPRTGFLHIASHATLARRGSVTGTSEIGRPESVGDADMFATALVRSAVIMASSARNPSGALAALQASGLDLDCTQLSVVLSACDTARGDYERGEGIYGLRRAFLMAGADTVVASLWPVDSPLTRTLMVTFYRNLFQRKTRADALREAASFTRLRQPHPYYWASFVLTGNTGVVKLPTESAR